MMHETLSWVIPSGVLVTLIIFSIKNNRDNDTRVNRVYERLDEVKKDNEKKYTNKDICEILHKQLQGDIAEIKADVKKLLTKANGRKG